MSLRRCKTCNTPLGKRLICASCFANAFEAEHGEVGEITERVELPLVLDEDAEESPSFEAVKPFSAIPSTSEVPLDWSLSGPKTTVTEAPSPKISKREERALKRAKAEKERQKKAERRKAARKRLVLATGGILATTKSIFSSFGGAVVAHVVALVIFSLILFEPQRGAEGIPESRSVVGDGEAIELDQGEEEELTEQEELKEVEETPTEDTFSQESLEENAELVTESSDSPVQQESASPLDRTMGPRQPLGGLVSKPRTRKRPKSRKAAAAKKYGGGREALNAVEAALAYMSRHQLKDGSWNITGSRYKRDKNKQTTPFLADPGTYEGYDIGVTSLALLCFLGADYTTESERYGDTVKRGLNWLIRRQNSEGYFDEKGDMDDGARVYNTALALLALSEACVKHPASTRYSPVVKKTLRFFRRYQNANGGWSYYSGMRWQGKRYMDERSDASITGWVAFGLYTAQEAGIKVDQKMIANTVNCFDYLADKETGETRYADAAPHEHRRGPTMAAIGLTVRRLLAPESLERVDRKAQKILLENLPEWEKLKQEHGGTSEPNYNSFYMWYYGALGTFFAQGGEGEDWNTWNSAMKGAMLPYQEKSGVSKGSWAPVESWLGEGMGRMYMTAMGCLTLEVYYRHKPKEKYRFKSASED